MVLCRTETIFWLLFMYSKRTNSRCQTGATTHCPADTFDARSVTTAFSIARRKVQYVENEHDSFIHTERQTSRAMGPNKAKFTTGMTCMKADLTLSGAERFGQQNEKYHNVQNATPLANFSNTHARVPSWMCWSFSSYRGGVGSPSEKFERLSVVRCKFSMRRTAVSRSRVLHDGSHHSRQALRLH